ncbi:NADH-quinone oxidoreductase subunit N [Myxococcota bacterium]|nr:NADH-quinone oxidoreductase subunit N [Myxococcota bacterium]MBU1430728.1 NADH-quinone oxidoreductase subunit N [Myxococcota bacterium]MBU1898098.1 NADH-quinone oxidoreductase subunit N [Myxococcota bacterium]
MAGTTESLARFAPELVLSATILAILIVDLIARLQPKRPSLLSGVALVGLSAMAGALWLTPTGDTSLFTHLLAFDGLARYFKGFFILAAALGVLFGHLSDEISRSRLGEYYIQLLCLTLGLSLLASAQNLLMLYLALELVSLPSYVLSGFRWWDRRASEAALKYVVFGGAASGVMLYGFSLIYGITGTLQIDGVAAALTAAATGGQGIAGQLGLLMAVMLSLAGFGYKVAAVPFHMWCPDVYEGAPTTFVAFLSVAPKAAGFAALIRFFVVGFGQPAPGAAGFPWAEILGIIAIGTMTLGNVVAVTQDNVKRLLAYSSIAQAGYLIMALAVGTDEAIRAVMLYLGFYLLMNMGAFFGVQLAGGERLSAFRGMASRNATLAITMAIFLFSLTGIPPFAGFIGKFYLFAAVLSVGEPFFYALAIIGVLNSAISLYYYAKVVRVMFLDKAEEGDGVVEVSRPASALLLALAGPTLLFGVWWAPLADLIDKASSILR